MAARMMIVEDIDDYEIEKFLSKNFEHKIYTYNNFIEIDEFYFGEEAIKWNYGWHYNPAARWAYCYGKLYFKSEDDLIEFKLRFL